MANWTAGAGYFVQRHSGDGHGVIWRDEHYGECACGASYYSERGVIADASGRYLQLAQTAPAVRPTGPHEGNRDAREPVRE